MLESEDWPPERYCTECMWAPDSPKVPATHVITARNGDGQRFACDAHVGDHVKMTMKDFWLSVAEGIMKGRT